MWGGGEPGVGGGVPMFIIFWRSKNCPWMSPTMFIGPLRESTLLYWARISMAFWKRERSWG